MYRNSLDIFTRYLNVQSLPAAEEPTTPKPAITISRQTGAGALTVGNLVAQELDRKFQGTPPCPWAVFDRNLVTKILADHHLSEEIKNFMPEDTKFPLTDALESLLGLHPSSWTLREYAKKTIRALATSGNVILVGRGAGIITALLPNVLHVRLVAPFHFRVQNYAEFHQISVEKAAAMVRETDEARHRYVQSYLGADVTDPLHYHLVINTERIGFQQAARIISSAVLDRVVVANQQKHAVYSN
jgi:cytidylate kinase